MRIENYKLLISCLPVQQQCFTTKRKTWNKAENEFAWLKEINEKLFGSNKTLTISREEIFETISPKEIIIKTIYWGYTAGMRGNNFSNILKKIDTIENAFFKLRQKSNPTTADFDEFASVNNKVEGIGLSTYSKLLYFFKISFNSNPCLILDQRLIDVFAGKIFSNFQQLHNIRYNNAEKNYLGYLQTVHQLAYKLETAGENVELFLFTFGKNLKEVNMNELKFSNTWNGYCPECLLNGKNIRMRLNHHDFYECEETGLQICILPGVQAVILNFRGTGKFIANENYADEIENGEILSPQNCDKPPFNHPAVVFGESEEIEKYISTIK